MFLESIRVFLWGIIKRVWILIPAFLLDPFDVYNRYINPNLPEQWRSGNAVDMPSEWFPFVLFSLLMYAALLTYHELRKDHQTLTEQVTHQPNKQAAVNELAELRQRGNVQIFNRRVTDDQEYDTWLVDNKAWWKSVVGYLEANFTVAEVLEFKNIGSMLTFSYKHRYGKEHEKELNALNARLRILQKIIDRHSS